jgi:hypothetical protein
MSISLQALADNSPTDRNFRKLAQLVIDTGGRSFVVRVGTGTLTWPGGSNYSNNLAVSHGCGTTPLIVIAIATAGPGPANEIRAHAYAYTATQFTAFAKYDPTVPGAAHPEPFAWVAIG